MKNITIMLLWACTVLSAQNLKLDKIATFNIRGIVQLKTTQDNEIVCMGLITSNPLKTYIIDTTGAIVVESNRPYISNLAFGSGKTATFSIGFKDSSTTDFKGYLLGNTKATVVNGILNNGYRCFNCRDYVMDQRNNIYSHDSYLDSDSAASLNSMFIKKSPNDTLVKSVRFMNSTYGSVRKALFREQQKHLYAYFDSAIIVMDTNLTVLEDKRIPLERMYMAIEAYDIHTLVGITENSLRFLDYELNLQKSYVLDSVYNDLTVDARGNLYFVKSVNLISNVYKARFEEIVTSAQEAPVEKVPVLMRNESGYSISVDEYDYTEIYDMQGRKEIKMEPTFHTGLSGILIFNVHTKTGLQTRMKVLAY